VSSDALEKCPATPNPSPDPRESELFRPAFSCMDVAAVLLDRHGKIIVANKAFRSICGQAFEQDKCPNSLLDVMVPVDYDEFSGLLESVIHCGLPSASLDTRLVDGKNLGVERRVTVSPLEDGEHFIATFHDVPAGGSTHAELKQRAQDLENLFYLISHNLKSPAVSIQGFARLLMDEGAGLSRADSNHYLERIRKNGERMDAMLQDLVAYSRVAKGGFNPETVSLADVMEGIRAELLFKIREREVEFKVAANLPTVFADREGIRSVFYNLIENAIKYAGEARPPVVEVGWEAKQRFLVFWVRDNGPGIHEKFHESAFDLFERAAAPAHVEGTGVGLAIVKRIVEGHGGHVRLSSAVNRGTQVFFTLPKPTNQSHG